MRFVLIVAFGLATACSSPASTPPPVETDTSAVPAADAPPEEMPGRPLVDPLPLDELRGFLPEVADWKGSNPTSRENEKPARHHQVERIYESPAGSILLRIIDTGYSPRALSLYSSYMQPEYERDTGSGYERRIDVDGFPAWERWDGDDGLAEVTVIINDRFVVWGEGSGVVSPLIVQLAVREVDLERLAEIAGPPVEPPAAP